MSAELEMFYALGRRAKALIGRPSGVGRGEFTDANGTRYARMPDGSIRRVGPKCFCAGGRWRSAAGGKTTMKG